MIQPPGASIPWIEDTEAEWHRDKIRKAKAAGKKVMMMSHHQLFTQCCTVGKKDGKDQALNHNLHRQVGTTSSISFGGLRGGGRPGC